MKTLRETLKDAGERKVAIGHFNISDLAALKAIFEAARELNLPVMIGVSEGEREFVGVRQAAALVKSLRGEYDYPIFLNADHTHSLEKIREAAEAGFDEILFDGSKLSLEENIQQTKEAVKIIRSIDKNILIEGEIGYIGSSSEVMKEKPEGIELTTAEEAVRFIKETGVDVLAPAVGNMHGLTEDMAKGLSQKRLDIERIGKIKEATLTPLTLHGGSGTNDDDFVAAIKAGINIVHINTEIRVAWRRGLEKGLKDMPNEVAPYKILPPAVEEIKQVVLSRMKLFNSSN
ncbi:MAG: class II fructose-bisphosphate aldolase [Patescibacteria group bacterium]|nr:class II fructose-bisphosphate aldolase [Patescibacteria group bacterium]MDE2015421.1 class II fructose-bisphosphate aldolase [Patescibacteria group bacterium]MDE2226964.1 class II fructose-bisphosphate aldolase [Patescibacteria group bacterium]